MNINSIKNKNNPSNSASIQAIRISQVAKNSRSPPGMLLWLLLEQRRDSPINFKTKTSAIVIVTIDN